MRKTFALFAALVLFAIAVSAHEGEEHVRGTVTKITDKSITIEDKEKKVTEVTTTADTKYLQGDATAALKDVKAGDRVVINARKSGDKLVATSVKIAVGVTPTHKH